MIKMKNLLNGNEWTWDRAKFTDRRFQMQEMYQRYLEEEDSTMLGAPTSKVGFYWSTSSVVDSSLNICNGH